MPKRPKRLPHRAQDVRMASGEAKAEKESSTESNSDSSASNSDFSSEDGSSDVSDLDKFEEAYKELGGLTAGVDDVDFDRIVAGNTNDDVPGLVLEGGLETLQTLANVPKTWPLARLTVPLSGFSKRTVVGGLLYGGYGNKCSAWPAPAVHQDVCQGPGLATCIPFG